MPVTESSDNIPKECIMYQTDLLSKETEEAKASLLFRLLVDKDAKPSESLHTFFYTLVYALRDEWEPRIKMALRMEDNDGTHVEQVEKAFGTVEANLQTFVEEKVQEADARSDIDSRVWGTSQRVSLLTGSSDLPSEEWRSLEMTVGLAPQEQHQEQDQEQEQKQEQKQMLSEMKSFAQRLETELDALAELLSAAPADFADPSTSHAHAHTE